MAKPTTSRSCDIVLRRYVLISFNFEKVLSHDTTVAGRNVNILSATDRFGYKSTKECLIKAVKRRQTMKFSVKRKPNEACYFAFQIECTNISSAGLFA